MPKLIAVFVAGCIAATTFWALMYWLAEVVADSVRDR